jgi:hypothetical protein
MLAERARLTRRTFRPFTSPGQFVWAQPVNVGVAATAAAAGSAEGPGASVVVVGTVVVGGAAVTENSLFPKMLLVSS